jgi:hypothetical protein
VKRAISLLCLAAATLATTRAMAADSSWFSWPSNGNKQRNAAVKKTSQSSSGGVVSSLTSAPKKLVASTKNAFTSQTTTSNARGTKVTQQSKNPKAQKQGFFKSMFNPDPPAPPQTINDWMRLKQIHP